MGLFLSLSSVMGASRAEVETALRQYALLHDGEMQAEALPPHESLIISEGVHGITAQYPSDFMDLEGVSNFLAQELNKPTFFFHIHDDDLWMYGLYTQEGMVDCFNTLPDYWGEITEEEWEEQQGDAEKVAQCVGVVSAEDISRYLVHWDLEEIFSLEEEYREKAYPDDTFFYGDHWQLVDFMRRLGLNCPMYEPNPLPHTTYRFHCKPEVPTPTDDE